MTQMYFGLTATEINAVWAAQHSKPIINGLDFVRDLHAAKEEKKPRPHGVTRHKATHESRVLQLVEKYKTLPKSPSGRLNKKHIEEWRSWLDAFGISPEYARRLMKESQS